MTKQIKAKKSSFFAIGSWEAMRKKRILFFLEEKKHCNGELVLYNEITPIDLYCYLKARFGEPNGLQTLLKNHNDSDNLIHWDWIILDRDIIINFTGFTTYTTIQLFGKEKATISKSQWKTLIQAIKQDFSNHGRKKSEVFSSLEKWQLFINPYKRMIDIFHGLCDKYDAINLEYDFFQQPIEEQEQTDAFIKKHEEIAAQQIEALTTGLSIKIFAPIVMESFINFIIFFCGKPEIKNNNRDYESTIREQIDLRITRLHRTCNHFKSAIDTTAEEYKSALRIFNQRNDLLHGNIDPLQLKCEVVYFDNKTTPLFTKGGNILAKGFEHSLKYLEPEEVRDTIKAVEHFIYWICTHLEEPIYKEISLSLDTLHLGWGESNKRVGILLPEYYVDMVPPAGTRTYEEDLMD